MSDFEDMTGINGQVDERVENGLKEPDLFFVVLHNDDYTTRDFVVRILRAIFHKPEVEANKIMLEVHKQGKGRVGTYSYDIAATKVWQVKRLAKEEGFPLRCSLEKA